jgi:predicted PurR-regulated permease PerM
VEQAALLARDRVAAESVEKGRQADDARVLAEPSAAGPAPPAEVRTLALVVLAVIVSLFALRTGAAFFIPLLLSLFLNYTLAPAVERMHSWGIPRAIAAAVAIALVAGVFGGAFYRVSNDAGAVLEQVPPAVQRLRVALMLAQRDHAGALEHVQRTAEELEKLAKAAASNPALSRAAPPATAEAAIDFRSLLLVGTGNVVIALGQLLSALFLSFFLLSAGDLFRRKLVHAAGPSLARQKTVLRILNDVDQLNQRYFAVVMLINIAVGLVTGLALYAIGMEQPLVWGIAAAILHIIPYIGAAAVASAAALVAYGQFGTIQWALLAGAMPLLAAGVLGVGLQTWLMGRAARMNAPVVFVSLLFWGMLWGGWGLLLAVPVMVAIRTICDHVERLKRFGEILGP